MDFLFKKCQVIKHSQLEDPFNLIYKALIKKGIIKEFSITKIPLNAFSNRAFEKKKPINQKKRRCPEKIWGVK